MSTKRFLRKFSIDEYADYATIEIECDHTTACLINKQIAKYLELINEDKLQRILEKQRENQQNQNQ